MINIEKMNGGRNCGQHGGNFVRVGLLYRRRPRLFLDGALLYLRCRRTYVCSRCIYIRGGCYAFRLRGLLLRREVLLSVMNVMTARADVFTSATEHLLSVVVVMSSSAAVITSSTEAMTSNAGVLTSTVGLLPSTVQGMTSSRNCEAGAADRFGPAFAIIAGPDQDITSGEADLSSGAGEMPAGVHVSSAVSM